MRITLVLLTMNEVVGARALFDQIPWDRFEEAIVVDGHSTDGTKEFFEARGIRVITQKNPGLGSAVIEAMEAITGDAAVFFHTDGNMAPADTLKFRALFDEGWDFVIASRMIRGAFNEEDGQFFKPRKWASLGFSKLASLMWQPPGMYEVRDPVNGFRGVTLDAFHKMGIDTRDCSVDYQMIIRAYKHGIRTIEFPTVEGERIHGETKFKSFPTGITLLKRFWIEIESPPPGDGEDFSLRLAIGRRLRQIYHFFSPRCV